MKPGARWRGVGPLPEPRWFLEAGDSSDGRVYAFGGFVLTNDLIPREDGIEERALVEYDPAADRWAAGPPVRHFLFTSVVPNRITHEDRRKEVIWEDRDGFSLVGVEKPCGG